MAKYGLFKGSSQEPKQEVEGDEMRMVGTEAVMILDNGEVVATFNLEKDHVIRKIK